MKKIAVVVSALPLLATAVPVAAEPAVHESKPGAEPDRWRDRPWVATAHLFAFGAPAGTFAVELEREIIPRLSGSVGTGVAWGGQQWAGMLRLRAPARVAALGFGAGLSHGDYEEWLSLFEAPDRREDVTWANGEVFVETRSQNGFTFRAYLGYSAVLTGGPCTSAGDPCDSILELPDAMPYLGIALGAAF